MQCPHCHSTIAAGDRFCGDCGQPISPPTAQARTLDEISGIYLHGDKAESRDLLREYVQRDARNAKAWLILGNNLRDLGELDEASNAYLKAVDLDPLTVHAYMGLANICAQTGFPDQAFKWYELAAKAEPNFSAAWTSMAVMEGRRGNYEQAVPLAEKAYALDPNDPVNAANLSIAYHRVGRSKDRDRLKRAGQLGYANLQALESLFH